MPKVYNKHHGDAPKDAVYIGRGSKWGNPHMIGRDGNRDEVCELFKENSLGNKEFVEMVKRELKGKDLVCFCKPARCHGDDLLRVANPELHTPMMSFGR